jgi:arylamine N-acetyltransferase
MEFFPISVFSALRELSALPYENLSKIVAFSTEAGTGIKIQVGSRSAKERALILASDWLEKTKATGVGGTCFSLTWWLSHRLKALGMDCAFLMGDKGQAKNVHCALQWNWQGRAYLLDPGYMIFVPLPLPEAGLSADLWVSPNQVRLEDLPALHAWRLWSGPQGDLKFRFDFRRRAVSEEEFLAHWEASFDLPMMRYPVLNRVQDGVQYYLQKRSLMIRTPDGATNGGSMRKLARLEMMDVLQVTFQIPESLAKEALDIVVAGTADFFNR